MSKSQKKLVFMQGEPNYEYDRHSMLYQGNGTNDFTKAAEALYTSQQAVSLHINISKILIRYNCLNANHL